MGPRLQKDPYFGMFLCFIHPANPHTQDKQHFEKVRGKTDETT